METAKGALEANAIRYQKAPEDPGARIEYFTDPDGTPLYLIELKWG